MGQMLAVVCFVRVGMMPELLFDDDNDDDDDDDDGRGGGRDDGRVGLTCHAVV